MRKPLTTIPQRTPRAPYAQQRENQEKAVCIIGGESEALGFHQETTEESRKRQDRFCIKTLHYIFTRLHSFLLYVSTNEIRTKSHFSTRVKHYKSQFKIQNTGHYFQLGKLSLNASQILNPKPLLFNQKDCYKFPLQFQNYRRYLNVSRNIIT